MVVCEEKKKKKKKSCDADWATCLETPETSSVRKVLSQEDGEHAVAFLARYPFLKSGAPAVGNQRHSTPSKVKMESMLWYTQGDKGPGLDING
ncbi:hypothetical protein BFJ68_g12816 [Fusarium oxysporum]|uniref:Uncharacterized protein n=2 Tax=Fusarium oxysporum TaxID=5507 RepID=A0A420Q6P2_FUSOX|nr:hypothetical protein BFJ65_g14245 [Fusarium oxysporum f. sp. cepae]RKK45537.1 hypothetical protein BFJ66_g8978 [Fusarium oxysporum f. sp. cepae]RKK53329.1 hypothetical protein BFJ67_g5252 [Fusarium oxysporum f. sp. cepae]RKL00404.1 hypothetical protein BFJ68_g12816 [Fusarium oxysporum]